MKKLKCFSVAGMCFLLLASVIPFAACGKTDEKDNSDDPVHTHSWAQEWSYDSTGHWHEALCDDADKADYSAHSMENGQCTVCDYDTVDRGTLDIADIKVWTNWAPTDFFPEFSKSEYEEELTYEYDESKLTVNAQNNTVTAVGNFVGQTTVTAKSKHFKKSFTVTCIDGKGTGGIYQLNQSWSDRITTLTNRCKRNVTENTTVFIGDSFMDERWFWTNFSDDYAKDKDAVIAGISSSTTYHWEKMLTDILGQTKPENIVIHIGTNNFYDAARSLEQTTDGLQKLFLYMHEQYPTSNIYFFGITYRADTSHSDEITSANSFMRDWCALRDYITYVDTPSLLTLDKLKDDGIHPKLESYSIMTQALENAGCEVKGKS